MANCMVIVNDNGDNVFHSCPCCSVPLIDDQDIKDEKIPVFYSKQHAIDSGWTVTKNIKFCPPNRGYVWVCPEHQG